MDSACLEGSVSKDQFEEHHADGVGIVGCIGKALLGNPGTCCFVEFLRLIGAGGFEVLLKLPLHRFASESEVAEPQPASLIHEQIVGLQVEVNHVAMEVQVVHALQQVMGEAGFHLVRHTRRQIPGLEQSIDDAGLSSCWPQTMRLSPSLQCWIARWIVPSFHG